MTFGEKVKEARLALNLSQTEVAQLTGISERSLYTYEQQGVTPRMGNVVKLAEALKVSVSYLMDEEEEDTQSHIDEDAYVADAIAKYGAKGAREVRDVLGRTQALFAGGDMDDEAKDVFFQAIMQVYLESKEKAREKFTPKKYRKHPSEDRK